MLIAVSGKKQSGKSTLTEFVEYNLDSITQTKNSYAKIDMADSLKQMLVDIFGIDPKFVYGSDEEKNQTTQYLWQDLPHYKILIENGFKPKNSHLTSREMMQQVGTDIFRKMNENIWIDAAVRKIKKSQYDIIFSADVRFPSEILRLREIEDSVTVRLTKDIFNDKHHSETALDKENFDWSFFDIVIDNRKMSIEQKNAAFLYALNKLDYISLDKDHVLFSPYFEQSMVRKIKINKDRKKK